MPWIFQSRVKRILVTSSANAEDADRARPKARTASLHFLYIRRSFYALYGNQPGGVQPPGHNPLLSAHGKLVVAARPASHADFDHGEDDVERDAECRDDQEP